MAAPARAGGQPRSVRSGVSVLVNRCSNAAPMPEASADSKPEAPTDSMLETPTGFEVRSSNLRPCPAGSGEVDADHF
jgi:hypothetical protein